MRLTGKNAIALACALVCLLAACKKTNHESPSAGCTAPTPGLDGCAIDIALAHNALVYDPSRNVYYASVPGSQPSGNSIATIDPATGQVRYSAPVGSEPNALAVTADGSALYVGLDGTGDVARLALPTMAEQGRTKLVSDTFRGQSRAETIAVSPADSTVVAVSMFFPSISSGAGAALLRDMVMQPKTTAVGSGNNLVTFDAAGTTLYGLNNESTEFGLRRMQVLADGLVEDLKIAAATDFGTHALGFLNNRVVAGHFLYDAPALTAAGSISTPVDCRPRRAGDFLLCFADLTGFGAPRFILADPGTFVIRSSLTYAVSESPGPHVLVEGQPGQVAISYPVNPTGFVSSIRLFTSADLLTPPVPPAPSWPVSSSSTTDGTVLDVGIVHNSLVFDSGHNVYYASVPGSVIGAGNSIATIDPATGKVTHSAPIGSEPSALAIAADGSMLYVGLDGSGEVERLALPSMTPQGRARLVVDSFFGMTTAESINVSPIDASVAAVSMAYLGVSPRHAGVALLLDMVMQPKRTQTHTGSNLVAFDATGTKVYGQNIETTEFGLRRIGVLADGLAEEFVVTAAVNFSTRALSFANGQVIDGSALYDAPALTVAGAISGAINCWAARATVDLLCFADPFAPGAAPGTLLVASSSTFVVSASLRYALTEPDTPDRLMQGPSGQVGISYIPPFNPPFVRLFSSAQLP